MSLGRTFSALLYVVTVAMAVVLAFSLAGATGATDQTSQTIVIPLPESDVAVQVDENGFCSFSGADILHIGQTGEPSIPYKSVGVLLPPNVDLATVKATITGSRWIVIDGDYNIRPVPTLAVRDRQEASAVWPADRDIVDGKDADIYENDALFPLEAVRKVDTQVMRGWKLAQVFYAPYAYNPIEMRIFQLSGNAIEITFERDSLKHSTVSADFAGAEQIRGMAANYAEAVGDYAGFSTSPATERYVIITTSSIKNASAILADFVASKEARGFTVQVVTEETWQGDAGGDTGDAAAEHIRSWLQANYLSLDVEYVLLIGNPNPSTGDVPMKVCYPLDELADTSYDVPTDFYFAELTSDWDADGDNRYGEYYDDFSEDPPRAAEVSVGRIPYYGSISDLDHILSKIIDYETAPENTISWRENALLPMKPSDGSTPGYQLGEEIKTSVLNLSGWTYQRIYDEKYGLSEPPEIITPCTVDNVTNAWNNSDFGAIFWWTHGSSTSASYVMDLDHAAALDDAHPGFAFQCSCSNGKPEVSNNLGYSLLKNGCIATVSASRDSWYDPGQTSFAGSATNSGMTFEYSKRLVGQKMYAGDALNDLRLDVPSGFEELWMNYLDFNLYGCPAVGPFTGTPDQAAPSILTYHANSVTTTSAQLRANLTSLGTADNVTVSFVWGTSPEGPYPYQTTEQVKTVTGAFSYDLSSLVPETTYYYQAKATGNGTAFGLEKSFTTLTTPPSVTTGSATDVYTRSATLNGNLDSLGTASSVTVSFVWGTTDGGPYPNPVTVVPSMTGTGGFSAPLSDLTPKTTYYYIANAVGHGSDEGDQMSFTTLAVPPSVTTSDAINLTTTSATLNGNLDSLGTAGDVTVSFQWGTTPGGPYASVSAGVKYGVGPFASDLTGLAPFTTYYFRAEADGDGDPVYGLEKSFTTGFSSPSVAAGDASNITANSVRLNGSLTWCGTSDNVGVSFVWGVAAGGPYVQETTAQVMAATGDFFCDLGGLTSGTTYFFNAKAVGHGTIYGLVEKSFTTFQVPAVESIDPVVGGLGQSMTVEIVGSHFTGVTQLSFGPEIVLESFIVDSAVKISAVIDIGCDATLGAKVVSVTSPGGTDNLAGGFAVVEMTPSRPRNAAPADKAGVMTLIPTLSSSVFSHLCMTRTHAASQWQITTVAAEYSDPLFNSGGDAGNLTSITVPRGIVDEHDIYYWRVRYQDNHGIWSDWSEETSFARPDFMRAELNGPAEIHVYDSMSRVTGSVDGETREGIAYSDYFSNTVTVVSPIDSYRYEVVGAEDGTYTLIVTRVIGDQDLDFVATDIPVSAGEIHQYIIDWDALSEGNNSVTIRIDSDAGGKFDRSAVVDGSLEGGEFVSATKGHETPAWVWMCVGLGALSLSGLFVLLVIARKRAQADIVP